MTIPPNPEDLWEAFSTARTEDKERNKIGWYLPGDDNKKFPNLKDREFVVYFDESTN